jgi:hypothetical protein
MILVPADLAVFIVEQGFPERAIAWCVSSRTAWVAVSVSELVARLRVRDRALGWPGRVTQLSWSLEQVREGWSSGESGPQPGAREGCCAIRLLP